MRTVTEEAPRGRILDAKGRVIVDNRTSRVVTVDPVELRTMEQTDRDALVLQLGRDTDQLRCADQGQQHRGQPERHPVQPVAAHPGRDRRARGAAALSRRARGRVPRGRRDARVGTELSGRNDRGSPLGLRGSHLCERVQRAQGRRQAQALPTRQSHRQGGRRAGVRGGVARHARHPCHRGRLEQPSHPHRPVHAARAGQRHPADRRSRRAEVDRDGTAANSSMRCAVGGRPTRAVPSRRLRPARW